MKVKSESEVAQLCPTLSDPMYWQPSRLLHPWDFPGKSTGVGCHWNGLLCLLPKLAKYCLFGQKKHISVIKNAQMVSLNESLLTI